MEAEGLDEKDALKRVARERGVSKSDVYRELQRRAFNEVNCIRKEQGDPLFPHRRVAHISLVFREMWDTAVHLRCSGST